MPESVDPGSAGIVGALVATLAIGVKWLTGRLSAQIDKNTEAVEKNTAQVARVADRFEAHMEKDETLDRELVESLIRLRTRVETVLNKVEN